MYFCDLKRVIMTDKEIKGILFDLDGVLIDTEGTYSHFWSEVDRRFPTGVENFAQVIKGSNLHNILHTYFPTHEMRMQVKAMLDEFQLEMKYDYFAGAVELLQDLNKQGVPCCIVTSSNPDKMRELYRQHPELPGYFKAIVTGDMVSEPKPSPECFELGAQKLGTIAKHCVVIEDSINGLRAGMASGARVIGLSTTCAREEIAPHCHMVAPNIGSLSTQSILNLISST